MLQVHHRWIKPLGLENLMRNIIAVRMFLFVVTIMCTSCSVMGTSQPYESGPFQTTAPAPQLSAPTVAEEVSSTTPPCENVVTAVEASLPPIDPQEIESGYDDAVRTFAFDSYEAVCLGKAPSFRGREWVVVQSKHTKVAAVGRSKRKRK